jgi:HK97 family phage portal protein
MPLLRDGIRALTRINTGRLPTASGSGGLFSSMSGAASTSAQSSNLQAMSASGWLFATVDRIASALAALEWRLYRKLPNGEREEIPDMLMRPGNIEAANAQMAQRLWRSVNPFYTRTEFIDTISNHFELTGEMWWVLVRNPAGIPLEIWPVRPDRMRPVPSPDKFIVGYIYQVGQDQIPLEIEDVVYVRKPHPTAAYRGMGVVQSIIRDVESEQASAEWTRNFFNNSAQPGGIIEFPEASMDDAQFDRLVRRWREQHQGVQNAHRVGIIEGGKWVDRKMSQRDMEFTEIRRLNRDIILGAWGMPGSLLGITENVNRANAEAADAMFSRWIVVPRANRIKGALNEQILPLFGDGFEWDFDDPVPANREIDHQVAMDGYNAGYLSMNEARTLDGLGAIDEGDEFKAGGPPAITLGSFTPTVRAPTHPEEVQEQETVMERGWRERLEAERERVIEFVEGMYED